MIRLASALLSKLKNINHDAPAMPVTAAFFACLACFLFLIWSTRPLRDRQSAWMVCLLVPNLISFNVLYRGGWRREFSRMSRISTGLLLTCIIYGCVLFMSGIMLAIGCFLVATFGG